MARFLHVGFNFPGSPKIKELEAPFSVAGDWVRYSPLCWVVWTQRSAQEVFTILKPYLINEDQFLIAEINMYERNGWLPEWIWKWMNERQQYQITNPPTGLSGLGSALSPQFPPSIYGLPPYNPYDPNKK
jgi:hypothetical protein